MPTNKVPAFNPIATGRAAALLLACATSACMTAPAGDARIWMGQVAEGRQTFSKPVKSWKELKFTNLVRQQTDFSCGAAARSEEHTSELQSLMRISYAVFCL